MNVQSFYVVVPNLLQKALCVKYLVINPLVLSVYDNDKVTMSEMALVHKNYHTFDSSLRIISYPRKISTIAD